MKKLFVIFALVCFTLPLMAQGVDRNTAEMQGKFGATYVKTTAAVTGHWFCANFVKQTIIDSLIFKTPGRFGWDTDTIVGDTMPAGSYIYGAIERAKFKTNGGVQVILYKKGN